MVFFPGLPTNADYTLDTDAPGYVAGNQTVTVEDTTREQVQLDTE